MFPLFPKFSNCSPAGSFICLLVALLVHYSGILREHSVIVGRPASLSSRFLNFPFRFLFAEFCCCCGIISNFFCFGYPGPVFGPPGGLFPREKKFGSVELQLNFSKKTKLRFVELPGSFFSGNYHNFSYGLVALNHNFWWGTFLVPHNFLRSASFIRFEAVWRWPGGQAS